MAIGLGRRVNVTNIDVRNITYVNTQVLNAVIATSSEQLGRGAREYTRPSAPVPAKSTSAGNAGDGP